MFQGELNIIGRKTLIIRI